ncbi:MAG: hypothetical protein QG608_1403 [Actinomycetota bacterium]|nr:hypothetical protein [Actinomycetota bacterium]
MPRHPVPRPAAPTPALRLAPVLRVAPALLIPALLLAACTNGQAPDRTAPGPLTSTAGSPTAQVTPTESKDPTLLDPDEATAIVDRLRTIVTAERASTSALSPRIIGPFRDRVRAVRLLRTGTTGTAGATGTAGTPSASASSRPTASPGPAPGIDPDLIGQDVATLPPNERILLTRGTAWPRWFLTVGANSGKGLPRVSVLLAGEEGLDHGIWAQMLLLPGRALPAVDPATEGAERLTPTAPGLVATPSQAALRYADLLNRGNSSTFVTGFASDDFRRQVREQLAADRRRMVRTQSGKEVSVGTITSNHAVRPDGILALRTADGGALVIASLRQTQVLKVTQKGGKLRPDSSLTALAGRKTFTDRLTRVSAEVLAFTVPKAGSGGKITLIGATKGDIAVTGS